jgi:hypothetical protein
MPGQLTIESPNFDRIRAGDGIAVENAIRLLWFVANDAADVERRDIQLARSALSLATLSDAPSVQQDNYNPRGAGFLLFSSAGAWSLTGIRNGVQGAGVFALNLGAGTVTLKQESASSDAPNRLSMQAGADKSLPTGKAVLFFYQNGRWREMLWA